MCRISISARFEIISVIVDCLVRVKNDSRRRRDIAPHARQNIAVIGVGLVRATDQTQRSVIRES